MKKAKPATTQVYSKSEHKREREMAKQSHQENRPTHRNRKEEIREHAINRRCHDSQKPVNSQFLIILLQAEESLSLSQTSLSKFWRVFFSGHCSKIYVNESSDQGSPQTAHNSKDSVLQLNYVDIKDQRARGTLQQALRPHHTLLQKGHSCLPARNCWFCNQNGFN